MSNKIAPISGKKSVGVSMTQLHQGPIPSAEEMRQYSQVFPDLPQRIVKMAEDEQKTQICHGRISEKLSGFRVAVEYHTCVSRDFFFSSLCLDYYVRICPLCIFPTPDYSWNHRKRRCRDDSLCACLRFKSKAERFFSIEIRFSGLLKYSPITKTGE